MQQKLRLFSNSFFHDVFIITLYYLSGVSSSRLSGLLFVFCLCFSAVTLGQEETVIEDYSDYKRGFQFKALVVGRYVVSMEEDINTSGLHFSDPEANVVTNSFEMQYVRMQTNFNINDKISASLLVNLAEFKSDPTSKVLENAFVKYAHNTYLNIQLGQFRPYFGIEDLHPFQLNNSYKWSEQYTLFGRNGWQSFQVGAAVFGSLEEKHVPLYYYLTVYNGNNRNQPADNDSSKNYTLRLEYNIIPELSIGINGGMARYDKQQGSAYGADARLRYNLTDKWDFDMNVEYKRGTNFEDYRSTTIEDPDLGDFNMYGVYALSRLRYSLNKPRIRALEFSFRHEYLDSNTLIKQNSRYSYIPMASIIFSGIYAAKFSIVGVINHFDRNIPDTTNYDNNQFIAQFQVAF
ncbi:porin [Sinomicrobium sp. M5D2P9]